MKKIVLQIFFESEWHDAAEVVLLGSEEDGMKAKVKIAYFFEYVEKCGFFEKTKNEVLESYKSISLRIPVSLEVFYFECWPSFLLDLFPQGHALKFVEKYFKLADTEKNYWNILATVPLSPPGNLRMKPTESLHGSFSSLQSYHSIHEGFSRQKVLDKGEFFLEHMIASGAPVSGSTGASGAAPKFLLRENNKGQFFADGALSFNHTKKFWLIKYPRGKQVSDLEILQVECLLFEVAKKCGLNTYGDCIWEQNCLFVERFDRKHDSERKKTQYLGLESFYSAIGSTTFGEFKWHEEYIELLCEYSTNIEEDVAEYVCRDVFNRMCRNTDNHGRNFSFLKNKSEVRLAPIYDVAPMAWDSEGIVRSTNWKSNELEWEEILHNLSKKSAFQIRQCIESIVEKTNSLEKSWSILSKIDGIKFYEKRNISEINWFEPLRVAQKRLKKFLV